MNTKPDARTAPKASIDALLTTLREQLAQPGQSLLPLLGAMSRFSKYSLANQMLIFAQRPDATRVQGYRAWNKAGYQVRKGEKGIAIYAPVRFTRADPSDESGTLEPHSRTGFRVAWVFDITQVDPLDGTTVESTPVPSDTGTLNAHRALEALKAFLSATTSSSITRHCSPVCSATPTAAASLAGWVRPRTSNSPPSRTRPPTCCCTSPGTPTAPQARFPT